MNSVIDNLYFWCINPCDQCSTPEKRVDGADFRVLRKTYGGTDRRIKDVAKSFHDCLIEDGVT